MEPRDCVANQDVPVAILQKKILSSKSAEDKAKYEKELADLMQSRELVRDVMHKIVQKSTDSDEHCEKVMKAESTAYCTKEYKEVVEHFRKNCIGWHNSKDQTTLKHLYLFSNLIEENVPVERIKSSIDEVCTSLTDHKGQTVPDQPNENKESSLEL